MGKQYATSVALLAEELFRSACLITGDASDAERLVLDTLRQEESTRPVCDAHALKIALYTRLVRSCLCTAKSPIMQSDTVLKLEALGARERAAVVLNCFSAFDEASAAQILGVPRPVYAWLLKKSVHKLTRIQGEPLPL